MEIDNILGKYQRVQRTKCANFQRKRLLDSGFLPAVFLEVRNRNSLGPHPGVRKG